jgi:hypothetical protein
VLPQIQGRSHVWFCGAWTRYGFHEDGLMSGAGAWCKACGAARPGGTRRRMTRPGGRMNAPGPAGIGVVRHRRLRPAVHAFAYPTYFLLLPMRTLRAHAQRQRCGATASAC